MAQLPFKQVDVFTTVPFKGNPAAVVLKADGQSPEQLQQIANWTNLSETTFVLPATDAGADHRVRLYTPSAELPFAAPPPPYRPSKAISIVCTPCIVRHQ